MKKTDPLSNQNIITQIRQYYFNLKGIHLQQQDIKIQSIFSLTNKVYHFSMPLDIHLLVKIYQNSLAEFTDNQLQTQVILKLSQEHKYPEIIYHCKSFRIELFLSDDNQRAENESQDDKIQKLTTLVNILSNYSINYCQFVAKYNKNHGQSKFTLNNLLSLYHSILKEKKNQCDSLIKECQSYLTSVLENEYIIKTLNSILSNVSMVLSHNDCHLGNIIINNKQLYLLDFQFTNFNYIGFDIGNLINQWATQYSPTFNIKSDKEIPKVQLEKIVFIYFQKLSKVYKIQCDVKKWMFYTQIGRVLSHFFWMIIGLKQINDQRIEFSMISYIKIRKEQFDIHFNKLLDLIK